ncbi:MAG: hypothetical protein ACD_61C00271G0005 [uncultured bacterium]|nr:MAG: hypothetical protein ACD_61C00271G0005 [uncultured bacterium]
MMSKKVSLEIQVSEILDKLKPQFNRNIVIDNQEFFNVAKEVIKDQEKIHSSLAEPKTCDLETYKEYVLYERFTILLVQKTTFPISKSDPLFILLNKIPPERIDQISSEINKLMSFNKKNKFLNSQKDLKEFDKLYRDLILNRNDNAQSNGYPNYAYAFLDKQGIKESLFVEFEKKVSELIIFCQKSVSDIQIDQNKIIDDFYTPCFLCDNNKQKIILDQNVIENILNTFEILKKYKDKIKIEPGSSSSMRYYPTDDTFIISINSKFSDTHKTLDLIHELSHVISVLQDFQSKMIPLSKPRYLREKEAIKIFISILREKYMPLYKCFIGNILNDLQQTLFEIKSYSNTEANYGLAYANIKHSLYPETENKKNFGYKLNKNLIIKPFANLIYSIAYMEILLTSD